MDKVWVTIDGKRRLGRVVTENTYTVWVKIMKGASSSFTVKRHKIKHSVEPARKWLKRLTNLNTKAL